MDYKETLVGKLAIYFKAMSEVQRMKIIKILASSMADTICVSDVAKILGISQPAATKHLKILEGLDLLSRKRIGTSVYYSLNEKKVVEYKVLIDHIYSKGFTKCDYEFKCEECPFGDTCV